MVEVGGQVAEAALMRPERIQKIRVLEPKGTFDII